MKSDMDSRTAVRVLREIWRRLEPFGGLYDRFPSSGPLGFRPWQNVERESERWNYNSMETQQIR